MRHARKFRSSGDLALHIRWPDMPRGPRHLAPGEHAKVYAAMDQRETEPAVLYGSAQPARAPRHRRDGKILSRRPSGARRPPYKGSPRRRDRAAAIQRSGKNGCSTPKVCGNSRAGNSTKSWWSRKNAELIEYQLKEHLYNWRDEDAPAGDRGGPRQGRIKGPPRDWQLPKKGEATPTMSVRLIVDRIALLRCDEALRGPPRLAGRQRSPAAGAESLGRAPAAVHLAPAASITGRTIVLPEGSRALARIGCHYMATWY